MNNSGIHSLAGFSYQIKTFVYYLSKLNDSSDVLGFETFEDISMKKLLINEDDGSEFVTTWKPNDSLEAIQVKRTKIDKAVAKRIMLNWLLIENNYPEEITKFVLITTDETVVDSIFNDLELKEEVKASKKRANSLEGKVKKICLGEYEKIDLLISSVREKIEIKKIENIDMRIIDSYDKLFHKAGVMEHVFSLRLNQFISCICNQIFKAIDQGNSFEMGYSKFMALVEEITMKITNEEIDIDYFTYKENLEDEDFSVSTTREFKQLKKCQISDNLLKTFLIKKSYYQQCRYSHMEMNLYSPIENLEETSYENFELAVSELQSQNNDLPTNRLMTTINKTNSYAKNEQIKHGVCIHLTGEKESNRLISWGDD